MNLHSSNMVSDPKGTVSFRCIIIIIAIVFISMLVQVALEKHRFLFNKFLSKGSFKVAWCKLLQRRIVFHSESCIAKKAPKKLGVSCFKEALVFGQKVVEQNKLQRSLVQVSSKKHRFLVRKLQR